MKIITFNDIKAMDISPEKCYEWVSTVIKDKKEALLPAKIHMNMSGNRFCNVMPGIMFGLDGKDIGGVKMVTRYPDRRPSLDSTILLFDADSGEMLSLMDGNWITAMRTGAVAAHSIVNFAKSEYSTIGIIGLGNTARATMLVLANVEKEKDLKVKLLKYKDQATLFAERFKEYSNLHFEIVEDVKDVVKGSDVILSCATYFENDICEDDCFDEGVLVVPVHTRGFTNCDLFFDKVYADDTSHVCDFKNFSKFRYYAEVTDVVNGIKEGRKNDKERILAYNIGISIHDIYYAANIYSMLADNGPAFSDVPVADLKGPTDKFWM